MPTEVKNSMDGVVKNFYTMITVRQLQLILGCSRATIYRTLKSANIERYFVPNHPGAKYLWGCSLIKLLNTPALKKVAKRRRCFSSANLDDANTMSERLGIPSYQVEIGVAFGFIPIVDGEIPLWYIQAIRGLLVLPLPYK